MGVPEFRLLRRTAIAALALLGPMLAGISQEMPNLPDINKQTLAGALATGTHGTGNGIKAIHGDVAAMRLVLPNGEVAECSRDVRPELFHSARVSLGAFGVLSEVTLQNRPLERVKKIVSLVDTEDMLRQWPALAGKHRNAEFLVLPFTSKSALITHDTTTEPVSPRGTDQDSDTLMDLKSLRDLFEFAPELRKKAAQSAMADIPPDIAIDEGGQFSRLQSVYRAGLEARRTSGSSEGEGRRDRDLLPAPYAFAELLSGSWLSEGGLPLIRTGGRRSHVPSHLCRTQ